MYCEIPTFNRCCLCLPLRPGLIVYGYFKLAFTAFYIVMFVLSSITFGVMTLTMAIAIPTFIVDVCMSIVFIVGGHSKRPRLLRIYMWYSIPAAAVFVMQFWALFGWEVLFDSRYYLGTAAVISVLVTMYVVFCVRTEILKLECNREEAVKYRLGTAIVNVKSEHI